MKKRSSRPARIVVPLWAALILGVAAIVPAALAGGEDHGNGQEADVDLQKPSKKLKRTWAVIKPLVPGGPRGVVVVRQKGGRIIARLMVYGLEPGTRHAAHIHGPAGSCKKPAARHAADFVDLIANAQGVATRKLEATVAERVVGGKGYHVMLHENPSMHGGDGGNQPNPFIACANLPRR